MKLRVNVQSTFYDDDSGNAYNVLAGAAGHRSGAARRSRDDRRAPRFVAHRRRRDRQRRRHDDRHGGDADPEGDRRAAAAHDSRRAVGRRRAGAARIEGLGRSSIWPATPTPPRAASSPSTSTSTTAPARSTAGTCRTSEEVRPIFDGWLEPLKTLGARTQRHRAGRLDRSSELHRRRRARLQPDSGLRQLRHPHPPHQHGHRRAGQRRRPPPVGDRHGDVRVSARRTSIENSRADAWPLAETSEHSHNHDYDCGQHSRGQGQAL